MEASIVVFSLRKDMKPGEKVKFCQSFYGRDTSTWKGKYSYRIEGMLDQIPHRKLARGVIIIRTSDLGRIMDRLKGNTEQLHVRSIVPEREDIDDLMKEKQQEKQE